MPTSSNYLCGCGRFMRPLKNDVTVEELMEDGAPYKLWSADQWVCDDCGHTIIGGFARVPLAEHYQPAYATTKTSRDQVFPGRCR